MLLELPLHQAALLAGQKLGDVLVVAPVGRDLVAGSDDLLDTRAEGQQGVAGGAPGRPDAEALEELEQPRGADLGAELATRHVRGGRALEPGVPGAVRVEVGGERDRDPLAVRQCKHR